MLLRLSHRQDEQVESSEMDKEFGPVPAPKKQLHLAYITKTLINEFWQDVAAGAKNEAAKYNITVDVQAAKDENSMIEQLNLAQTMLSQKPDALLLSPQSDSNLAPVIEAAHAANIPTIIIDDARTAGASTYIGTDQVAIGAKAADFLHQIYPNGGKVAQIEGAAGSPNARAAHQGLQGRTRQVFQSQARGEPAGKLGPVDRSQRHGQHPEGDPRSGRHLRQQRRYGVGSGRSREER